MEGRCTYDRWRKEGKEDEKEWDGRVMHTGGVFEAIHPITHVHVERID